MELSHPFPPRRDVARAATPSSNAAANAALEAQVKEHATALQEAMRHLRESTARDAASDELKALAQKVDALATARGEDALLGVDRQLRDHDDRLKEALGATALNDVASREELKTIQRQIADLRDATGRTMENLIAQRAAASKRRRAFQNLSFWNLSPWRTKRTPAWKRSSS